MPGGTFNLSDVSVIVSGAAISGYADASDVVMVARNSDMTTLSEGSDGESCFFLTGKKGGTITLKLHQASQINDILSGIVLAMESAPVPFPILINDNNGASLAATPKALPQKMPDSAFGNDANDREWVFLCSDLDIFIGGVA